MMIKELIAHTHVAEGIARLLHPYAEVVIHDLVSQTVVFLANNFSKRKIGSPSLLEEINFNPEEQIIGPYEKLNWDGKKLKSISIVLRNQKNAPIALMCINMDVSSLDLVKNVLDLFLNPSAMTPKPVNLFKDDWHEKINIFVHDWLREHQLMLNTLNRNQKRQIVEQLIKEGAFNGKKAADYIAGVLGLGRATIYNYLKELKA